MKFLKAILLFSVFWALKNGLINENDKNNQMKYEEADFKCVQSCKGFGPDWFFENSYYNFRS